MRRRHNRPTLPERSTMQQRHANRMPRGGKFTRESDHIPQSQDIFLWSYTIFIRGRLIPRQTPSPGTRGQPRPRRQRAGSTRKESENDISNSDNQRMHDRGPRRPALSYHHKSPLCRPDRREIDKVPWEAPCHHCHGFAYGTIPLKDHHWDEPLIVSNRM